MASVASQPPTDERYSDCGEKRVVQPASWSARSSSPPFTPAGTVTVMSISSISCGPVRPETSSTIPPRVGSGCPVTDEPSARVVTGIPVSSATRSTATTSASSATLTTTSAW